MPSRDLHQHDLLKLPFWWLFTGLGVLFVAMGLLLSVMNLATPHLPLTDLLPMNIPTVIGLFFLAMFTLPTLRLRGEQMQMRTWYGRTVTIDAPDVLRSSNSVATGTSNRITVKDVHGNRIAWPREPFPQRLRETLGYFAIRNHLERNKRIGWFTLTSQGGMCSLSTEPMQLPDGSRVPWDGTRTLEARVILMPHKDSGTDLRAAVDSALRETPAEAAPPHVEMIGPAVHITYTGTGPDGQLIVWDQIETLRDMTGEAGEPARYSGVHERWT